jgi:hypothetical protein
MLECIEYCYNDGYKEKGFKTNSNVYKVNKCRDKTDRKYKVERVSYSMVKSVKRKNGYSSPRDLELAFMGRYKKWLSSLWLVKRIVGSFLPGPTIP